MADLDQRANERVGHHDPRKRERWLAGQMRRGVGGARPCVDCAAVGMVSSDNSKAAWRARRVNHVPQRNKEPLRDMRHAICNSTGLLRVLWNEVDGLWALLAYVGDAGARLRVDRNVKVGDRTRWWQDGNWGDGLEFAPWLRGFDRWHDHVLVVAAAAAAKAVAEQCECHDICGCAGPEVWDHRQGDHGWCGSCVAVTAAWRYALAPTAENRAGASKTKQGALAFIRGTINELGETTLRRAICVGLTDWATTGCVGA